MTVWIENPFDNLPTEGFRKQRYWLMAEAFVRAGHRVVLWTSDFNHTTKRARAVKGAAGGFEVRFVPTLPYARNVGLARTRSHRAYARTWERLAAAEREAPDLIVASLPTIGGAETALRLGRRFGARVVIDVMDAWPETFERLAPRGFGWLAHLALGGLYRRVRRVYREATLVSGVSERYRALSGRSDYLLAYHGIERVETAPAAEVRREGLQLVYAGNLGVTYDLGCVIRAVAQLGDVTLDIAGQGAGEPEWKRLAADLGVQNRVRFHGYLGEDALCRLLASCTVGVVPMPAESFVGVPYKLADYAAAGLAVVSSLGGESAALLERFGCGAGYAAGDVGSLVAALEKLRARLPQAGEGARRLATEVFDAARIYDGFVRNIAITLALSRL